MNKYLSDYINGIGEELLSASRFTTVIDFTYVDYDLSNCSTISIRPTTRDNTYFSGIDEVAVKNSDSNNIEEALGLVERSR